ncbi:hypothetical protein MRB53_038274 [Persea americana]|nr:hypothetical protein MRB53_038274 [Persea americana]
MEAMDKFQIERVCLPVQHHHLSFAHEYVRTLRSTSRKRSVEHLEQQQPLNLHPVRSTQRSYMALHSRQELWQLRHSRYAAESSCTDKG